MAETTVITEEYVMEKECKHSWRMKPKGGSSSKLNGMSIYLPKTVAEKKPKSITLTVEVPK